MTRGEWIEALVAGAAAAGLVTALVLWPLETLLVLGGLAGLVLLIGVFGGLVVWFAARGGRDD